MGTDNTTIDRSSGLESALEHIQTFSLVVYCVIIVVGTVGNGLVIYVTGFKMKKTVNSVWFLNLALADFLFTAFLVFTAVSLSQQHHWPFGQSMCKLNNFVSLVNMFASVFFLTAINLDRCLSTWVVAWAQNERTVFKAQIISAVIWFAAAICSTPYACFRIVTYQDNDTQCIYNSTIQQKQTLYTFRFVVGFLIPFLTIFFSYVAIGIRSKRLQNVRKHLSHRVIVFIIVAFFVCWLPFHVVSFIELASSKRKDLMKIVRIGGPLSLSLAFMNSCLNPILYVFIRDDFQNQLHHSVYFVVENALAEDFLPSASSRFLSPQLLRSDRKSESSVPV
ncbi:C3a anaphylatoxin chemotactic receptor-like [Poeciliopsis prolifica]|uniref:C3a anaphylatoxin chemotactic receptor-like n=1 Tax=Poeciliopsis prolifica TaxID=188132 RepID=UPI002413B18E|nr:C3a anaphylatoxin chemotactic receptor-like [Poeciliopsis prolifica]